MTRLDDDLDRLAAEHALGSLDPTETLRAERLIDSNPDFAAAVARWRERLSELDRTATPIQPSEALWQRIEDRLGVVPAAMPAPPAPVPDRWRAMAALWRSLAFWRIAGVAGAFATVALAIGLTVLLPRERTPVLVAVLLTEANRPAAVVNAYQDGSVELVPIEPIQVPEGRALEVWTQTDPARGPVSVGLVQRARTIRLDPGKLPAIAPNQFFAISLEPQTGSPTGRPTGPVLMKGTTSTAL